MPSVYQRTKKMESSSKPAVVASVRYAVTHYGGPNVTGVFCQNYLSIPPLWALAGSENRSCIGASENIKQQYPFFFFRLR